ncbi:MAG TPA: helix-turn-helix transcriptional regulator [Acidimicrobiales bacterium]|nr:helix-turn-helix transcriptional regulator [Acidimicrobiales bacterium]
MSTLDRIERICGRDLDDRALRIALLAEIRAEVAADAYAWLLTDPETCVGASPLAETPSLDDLPTLIRLKYLTPANRWTALRSGSAATLVDATGGDRSASPVWDGLLSGYGVDDVLSTVFRDRHGCWGFLDLWRRGGTFTRRERDLVGRLGGAVTAGLRGSLAATFARPADRLDAGAGPVVLLLGDDLRLLIQTPATDAYLRDLLPTAADRAPVPAAAYNVAAQLLAREQGVDAHPPSVRVHLRDGVWVTLRAARVVGTPPAPGASIAVSLAPTPPAERAALYARVAGLSAREGELLRHLVAGCDTRELARRLHVSEHTVQDHLKSVFDKTGARNRRTLLARINGR